MKPAEIRCVPLARLARGRQCGQVSDTARQRRKDDPWARLPTPHWSLANQKC